MKIEITLKAVIKPRPRDSNAVGQRARGSRFESLTRDVVHDEQNHVIQLQGAHQTRRVRKGQTVEERVVRPVRA